MKTIYKYIAVFVALIGAYLLFGAGAYWMPDSTVRHHVAKTVERGDLASDQPRAFLPQEQCRMDNFTDALILNQAYVMREEGFLSGLMLLPRWWGPELPFEVLRAGVDGREMPLTHYGRYWHGNTFLSRYLLVAYDYISIRMLLYIVSSLLLLWCMVLLWRKEGWQTAVAMMFGLLSCYMFMMQFSMQFVMVLVLALAGIIAVARGCKGSMAFFVIGSLTCYFDLLTAPMLTLGLMLVAQAALAEEKGFWQGWWRSLRSALLWAIGSKVSAVRLPRFSTTPLSVNVVTTPSIANQSATRLSPCRLPGCKPANSTHADGSSQAAAISYQ